MDIFGIATGAVGVGVVYFLYLAASKGLPAAVAWLKAKWSAGKAELAVLRTDVDAANAKVDALAKGAVAELEKGLAALRAELTASQPAAAAQPVAAAGPGAA